MPSWQAHLLRFLVRRRLGPVLHDMTDVLRVRKVFNDALPPPRGARFTAATVGGIAGEWVEAGELETTPAAAPRPMLMYVHGGGFVGGSPVTHRPITAAFALHGFRVFVPHYRVAPEFAFPAPLDDVVAAWRGLRALHAEQAAGQRLVVAGDSAGGNLALALMLSLRTAGEAMPDAAALFSPSTDLTGESPSLQSNTGRDPMFHGPSLEHLVRAYLGPDTPATNPLASPLHADLAGLPPLLLHVGEEEVLRDDGLRLAAKARAAGVHVEAVAWAVVTHAWQLVARLPEARQSLKAAASFLRDATAGAIEHLDTVVIGAGLSGIGAGVHLQARCPGRRFAILEARPAMGGTWDLFRYPGVRSDSDMYTLGYAFKPWQDPKTIADGPSIRRYIEQTAHEHGLDHQIRYGHRVVRADWSTAHACWTLEIDRGPALPRSTIRADFVLACSGYYRYAAGHAPKFAGMADFRGRIVHPQWWPEGLDYAGKRVVVIGSGATAVTLVPELAKSAAHVTMLQRSPTYVVSLPSADPIADRLRRHLPAMLAYRLVRVKNVVLTMVFFTLSRRWPLKVKARLIELVRAELGPKHDVDTHFTPRYNPWDQRVCIVPDGDLFKALADGRAEVVTDKVDTFTPRGLRLASGRELDADIIVTATGLTLNLLGDVAVSINGLPRDLTQSLSYKAVMLSGVPNLIYTFGYTNASWTLKADLTAGYACRLFRYMDAHGQRIATAQLEPGIVPLPFLDFSSGYVQRAAAVLPRQGAKAPWNLSQNYVLDLLMLRFGRIADGTLKLNGPPAPGA